MNMLLSICVSIFKSIKIRLSASIKRLSFVGAACANAIHCQPCDEHSETDRQRCFKTVEGSQQLPLLFKDMNKGAML